MGRAVVVESLGYGNYGVDIIRDNEGNYSVIEVNSIPAWKGLQSVCHIDVADLLVEDLISRCLRNEKRQQNAAVSCL